MMFLDYAPRIPKHPTLYFSSRTLQTPSLINLLVSEINRVLVSVWSALENLLSLLARSSTPSTSPILQRLKKIICFPA